MYEKLRKLLTLGLVLLIAGVAGFGWVLRERKQEKQLLHQQQEMLDAKLVKLNKLLSGEISIQHLADVVPEEKWQEELTSRDLAKKRTTRSLIFSASAACMAIGTTIFACWLFSWIARCAMAGLSRSEKFFPDILRHQRSTKDNQLTEACQKEGKRASRQQKPDEPALSKANLLAKNKLHTDHSAKETEEIDVLYCDEKSLNPEEQPKSGTDHTDLNVTLFDQLEQNIRKTILSGYRENTLKVEDSLKAQSENLEKQVTEFKQMTQTVKEAAIGHSEPLGTTLAELTQEVSAIREYASCQHDRIEKLQEGYDWGIIRTFCLRVIRCIDNLENRIARLSEQDIDTTNLQEIKDELLFALESSGIEQFEPEINSDYSGQEKLAEVTKDKVRPNDPKMRGKIAQVIKPGYQYVIDDENVKVVRTARVKLFV